MANRNNARRHLKRTQLSGGWGNSNKYNSVSPGLYLERFFGNAATLHVDAEPDDDEDEYQGEISDVFMAAQLILMSFCYSFPNDCIVVRYSLAGALFSHAVVYRYGLVYFILRVKLIT